jgi:transposase-like protein
MSPCLRLTLQEFRDDVVAVARGRDEGVTLQQVADDFGISEATLANWLKAGVTSDIAAELKALRRRAKLLEQENEVLRRAAALSVPGELETGRLVRGSGRVGERG